MEIVDYKSLLLPPDDRQKQKKLLDKMLEILSVELNNIEFLQYYAQKGTLNDIFMTCIQLNEDDRFNYTEVIQELWEYIPHSFFKLSISDLEYIIEYNDDDKILEIAQDILLELEYMYLNYDKQ